MSSMAETDVMSDEAGSEKPDLRGKGKKKKVSLTDLVKQSRVMPHSLEAEQGVLGSVIWAPHESLGMCVEKIKRGKEAFYDQRHQDIYEVLVEMYDGKTPIDLITLHEQLKKTDKGDHTADLAYLNFLQDSVPSPANLPYYLDILREKHLLRTIIHTCTNVIVDAYDREGNVDKLLDEVERDILKISQEKAEESGVIPIKDLVTSAINAIEQLHSRQGELPGVATGFRDLDKMTTGFHGGEMIVIAARPSVGKTSLAMNIAEHIAVDKKIPVGVFSLEMTSESLIMRMVCSRAKQNLRKIREGFMSESDFPAITQAAGEMARAPLYIDDTPGLSILQMRAKARRMAQQWGVKFFVVDYLQLLHSTAGGRDSNRQQEIADISGGIKALAKELNVPVIVLSQLNREMEKDKNRKPRLSDLRESGSIEQDADLVGLLYRPEISSSVAADQEEKPEDRDQMAVNLYIAKQRNGPTGDVGLTFFRGITRFETRSYIDDPSEG